MKEAPRMQFSRSQLLSRVMTCYGIGIALPALLVSIPYALLTFPLWLIGGLIAGLPVLLLALIVVAVFSDSVNRKTALWCAFAPVLAVLSTSVVIGRGLGLSLSNDEAKIYLVLSFICSSISAASFYKLSRDPASDSDSLDPRAWT